MMGITKPRHLIHQTMESRVMYEIRVTGYCCTSVLSKKSVALLLNVSLFAQKM